MSHAKTYSRAILAGISLTALGAFAFAGNPSYPAYTPDMAPANPVEGECYARVEIPAQYRTASETVMIEDGYSTVNVTQPQIISRQEQIVTKEASVRYQVRQPTFRSVTEQITVRPAYDKLEVTPPKFSNIEETLRVSQPRLVWKKGNPGKLRSQGYKIHSTADAGVGGRGYSSTVDYGRTHSGMQSNGMIGCGPTCEIWCLVEEPGETVSFNRKVMAAPAQVQRVPVPAKYRTVTKQVVADPGGVREIPVPAQYRSIMVEDVIPGSVGGETHVPPVYGDVAKKVLVSPERYEWRRVICKPGTLPSIPTRTEPAYNGSSYSSGVSHGTTYSSGSSHTGQSYSSGSHHSGYGSSHTSGATYSSGHSRESRTYGQYGERISPSETTYQGHFQKRKPWRSKD